MKKSKIDKGNKLLSELEERNITSDRIESIKNALEIENRSIDKKGRQDRFSKNASTLDNDIIDKMIDDLEKEKKRLDDLLASDKRQKNYDISDQDFIDMNDTASDYVTDYMYRHCLSSQQVHDIFAIVDEKNLDKKTYEKVIYDEIEKELNAGKKALGYRNVQSPDKLSRHIRGRFYRYKTR